MHRLLGEIYNSFHSHYQVIFYIALSSHLCVVIIFLLYQKIGVY